MDPLDGTANFVERDLEGVTTLIGLTYKEKPVFGVVHQLCTDPPRSYWVRAIKGGQGVGVYLTTDLTYGSHLRKPDAQSYWRMAVSKHHSSEMTSNLLRALNPHEVLRVGGCGFKMISVMHGRISDYIQCETGTSKWDTCAGEALIRSMGGFVYDIRGRALTYRLDEPLQQNEGLVATLDQDHAERIVSEAKHILPVKGFL